MDTQKMTEAAYNTYSLSFSVIVSYVMYRPLNDNAVSLIQLTEVCASTSLADLISKIDECVQCGINNLNLDESEFERAILSISSLDIRENGLKVIEIPVVNEDKSPLLKISSSFSYPDYKKAKFSRGTNHLMKGFIKSLPEKDKLRIRGFDLEDRLGL